VNGGVYQFQESASRDDFRRWRRHGNSPSWARPSPSIFQHTGGGWLKRPSRANSLRSAERVNSHPQEAATARGIEVRPCIAHMPRNSQHLFFMPFVGQDDARTRCPRAAALQHRSQTESAGHESGQHGRCLPQSPDPLPGEVGGPEHCGGTAGRIGSYAILTAPGLLVLGGTPSRYVGQMERGARRNRRVAH